MSPSGEEKTRELSCVGLSGATLSGSNHLAHLAVLQRPRPKLDVLKLYEPGAGPIVVQERCTRQHSLDVISVKRSRSLELGESTARNAAFDRTELRSNAAFGLDCLVGTAFVVLEARPCRTIRRVSSPRFLGSVGNVAEGCPSALVRGV